MPASWTIELQGQSYEVTVAPMPNGKDVIRANGRVAAKPLDASDFERTIVLGHRHYNVTREADGTYSLTPLGSQLDLALALPKLTSASEQPSRISTLSFRVAPIAYAALVAILAGGLYWSFSL